MWSDLAKFRRFGKLFEGSFSIWQFWNTTRAYVENFTCKITLLLSTLIGCKNLSSQSELSKRELSKANDFSFENVEKPSILKLMEKLKFWALVICEWNSYPAFAWHQKSTNLSLKWQNWIIKLAWHFPKLPQGKYYSSIFVSLSWQWPSVWPTRLVIFLLVTLMTYAKRSYAQDRLKVPVTKDKKSGVK